MNKKDEATPQQKEAVLYTGGNVLVFASAGGGKTKVLVDRLTKRIVEDRLSLSHIVAMTFTNAAAANIRKRLEKKISALLAADKENAFLRHQRTLLSTAHISTIHSFCLAIIKEFGYIIGLPRSLSENLLEEGDRHLLLEECLEELIATEEVESLQTAFSTKIYGYQSVKDHLLATLRQAEAVCDPYRWCEEKKHSPAETYDDIPDIFRDYYFASVQKELTLLLARGEKIPPLCPATRKQDWETYLRHCEELQKEKDYPLFLRKAVVLGSVPAAPTKAEKETNPTYEKLRADFNKQMGEFAKRLENPETLRREYNRSLTYEHRLLDLTQKLYRLFCAKKKERCCIDYSDYEHFAYQILTAKGATVSKILQERYQEIMVDEFQDTSSSQYQIISLVSRNNLFLVGDVKQSIYRFRNAKPEIMSGLMNDPSFHKITIPANFRSKKNIVAFNNLFFSRLMNIQEETYRVNDFQEAPLASQAENNVKIRFLSVQAQHKKQDVRALYLVQEVLKAHEEGVALKDMAVILRSHSEEAAVCDAFRQYGIPYVLDEKSSYFNSLSMIAFMAFVKLVISPTDNRYRVAVLQAFYRLNDDEIFHLKSEHFRYPPLEEELKTLLHWRHQNQFFRILHRIPLINDYYQKLDNENQVNLDYFFEQLPKYRQNTLEELVEMVEICKLRQQEAATCVSEESPVVKIMTIHHAKGLQFDTVFFLLNHQEKDKNSTLICDEELGIGFTYTAERKKCRPIQERAIRYKNYLEELAENQRLLYVAFTRAERRLILLDASPEESVYSEDTLLHEKKGFTSYLNSLTADNPHLEKIVPTEEARVYVLPKPKEEEAEALPPVQFPDIRYENISASSLEKHEDVLDLDAIFGMEYGTRIHHLFEQIDYRQTVDDDYYLTLAEDISAKEISILKAFVENPLIRRLRETHAFFQEYPYYLQDGAKIYHGFMDLVAIKGEEDVILIDYKTDVGCSDEELKALYTPQQKSYADVLRKAYPHASFKAYLYLTSTQRFLELSL